MNEPPVTTITDSAGRTLACYLETEAVVDGTTYGLLTPVDTPVVLVRMGEDGAEDKGRILEWEDHEDVLSTFDACLEPCGVKVIRSAATLTVAGEVDGDHEPEEDEVADDEDGIYDLLVSIKHTDNRIYGLYIPLDPFFVVAKARGFTGELLEGDEFKRIMPEIKRVLEAAE